MKHIQADSDWRSVDSAVESVGDSRNDQQKLHSRTTTTTIDPDGFFRFIVYWRTTPPPGRETVHFTIEEADQSADNHPTSSSPHTAAATPQNQQNQTRFAPVSNPIPQRNSGPSGRVDQWRSQKCELSIGGHIPSPSSVPSLLLPSCFPIPSSTPFPPSSP